MRIFRDLVDKYYTHQKKKREGKEVVIWSSERERESVFFEDFWGGGCFFLFANEGRKKEKGALLIDRY